MKYDTKIDCWFEQSDGTDVLLLYLLLIVEETWRTTKTPRIRIILLVRREYKYTK